MLYCGCCRAENVMCPNRLCSRRPLANMLLKCLLALTCIGSSLCFWTGCTQPPTRQTGEEAVSRQPTSAPFGADLSDYLGRTIPLEIKFATQMLEPRKPDLKSEHEKQLFELARRFQLRASGAGAPEDSRT